MGDEDDIRHERRFVFKMDCHLNTVATCSTVTPSTDWERSSPNRIRCATTHAASACSGTALCL